MLLHHVFSERTVTCTLRRGASSWMVTIDIDMDMLHHGWSEWTTTWTHTPDACSTWTLGLYASMTLIFWMDEGIVVSVSCLHTLPLFSNWSTHYSCTHTHIVHIPAYYIHTQAHTCEQTCPVFSCWCTPAYIHMYTHAHTQTYRTWMLHHGQGDEDDAWSE